MSLDDPYFVYGFVYDVHGELQNGAEIKILDLDENLGIVSDIVTEDGYYQINIQDIVNDGDRIQVQASYNGNININPFVLNINDLFKRVDISLETFLVTDSKSINVDIT